MRKILIAASILAIASGAAVAQDSSSKADKPGAAGQQPTTDSKQTSPGTTGAMQPPAGVATNPQDVEKQGGAATAPGSDDKAGKSSVGGGGMEKPK